MSRPLEPHVALRRVFRTLHLPAGPFQPDVERRELVALGDGSRLDEAQMHALAAAGGPEVHLVEYVWSWTRDPEPLAIHPMDLRTGYPPLEVWRGPAMEHALVAIDGSWGLLGTEDLDAVLGGPREIVDAALPGLGVTGAAAAPAFLEEFPDWAQDVLAHLYGTDWRATLGL